MYTESSIQSILTWSFTWESLNGTQFLHMHRIVLWMAYISKKKRFHVCYIRKAVSHHLSLWSQLENVQLQSWQMGTSSSLWAEVQFIDLVDCNELCLGRAASTLNHAIGVSHYAGILSGVQKHSCHISILFPLHLWDRQAYGQSPKFSHHTSLWVGVKFWNHLFTMQGLFPTNC